MNKLDFNNTKIFATALEALLLAADKPLSLEHLIELFEEGARPSKSQISAGLEQLSADIAGRSYQVNEVASGFRLQVRTEYSTLVGRLWEERPQRYSRAMLETLALIAYRQPVTRGEIEDVRGVAVSSNIIKTLLEREWIRVVGYKDVPGKPAMLATTKTFLDYFNLRGLDELPNLNMLQEMHSAPEQPVTQVARVEAPQASLDAEAKESADGSADISFGALLEELESMEAGLVTEMIDNTIDNKEKPSGELTGPQETDL